MSPKVQGDASDMMPVTNKIMAFLTRGTPDSKKFCSEGTDTAKDGYVQISRAELQELNTRSSQRTRIENWLRNVQEPAGEYPPTYINPPVPDPNYPTRYCYPPGVPKPKLRLDPPETLLKTEQTAFGRSRPLNLPSEPVPPIIPKPSPVESKAKSLERERNLVTPPNWGLQYDQLATAYLKWKEDNGEYDPSAPDLPPDPDKGENDHKLHPTNIQVLGKTWLLSQYTAYLTYIAADMRECSPNSILISHGILSNAQWSPQWAVSLRLLEEFHAIRTNSARTIGIEKFLRPLIEAQGKLYTTSLYNRFRLAYAAYVGILRNIQRRDQSTGNNVAGLLESGGVSFGAAMAPEMSVDKL